MSKLTEKQKQFCREYLIDLNATQACIRAGYSKKTAQAIATENLSKPLISEYLQVLLRKREERTEVNSDMVIKELARLAFADIRDLYDEYGELIPVKSLNEDTAATISSFKSRKEIGDSSVAEIEEYRRYDKTKALEMLGRHFGMFNDKLKVEAEFNLESFVKNLDDSRS